MKKLFAYLAVFGMMSFSSYVNAQEEVAETDSAAVVEVVSADEEAAEEAPAAVEEQSVHKMLKTKFIEGGVEWMLPVLACIILGLAVAIERIIYLSAANTNTKKLLKKVEEALQNGGVEAAKDVCRNTRGPVASIFYQGLDRYDEGLDNVEKAVVSYGSVQMGLLESGLPWLALFIALSPSLGFMGTVVGMIQAFDSIQAMGDISPIAVAGGIKVALLTTIFGLIAAVVLQVFYNYILVKIDGLLNKMEDASISFMDILVRAKK
jgi:biopolymer transport protein ExbB